MLTIKAPLARLRTGALLALAVCITGATLPTSRAQTLDATFQPPSLTNEAVAFKGYSLPNDRIYVYSGNGFIGYDRYAGEQRGNLLRFLPDGTLDTSFFMDRSLHGYSVQTVTAQTNGKVIVAASPPVPYSGVAVNTLTFYDPLRSRVFRLNADGSLDTSFTSGKVDPQVGEDESGGVAQIVRALVVQPDGKILVGGEFGGYAGQGHPNLVRLNANGSVDTTFAAVDFQSEEPAYIGRPDGIGSDTSILLQTDGRIIVSGAWDSVNGAPRPAIARLMANGTLDAGYAPTGFIQASDRVGTRFAVRASLLQPDGKALFGGPFLVPGDKTRHAIVRLDTNGNVDTLFDAALEPGAGPGTAPFTLLSVALLPDGRVLGGYLDIYLFGADRSFTGAVQKSASFTYTDPFQNGGATYSLLNQSGGRVIEIGVFNAIDGVSRPSGVARLIPATTGDQPLVLDPSFQLGQVANNDYVSNLAVRNDGSILVGGLFDAAENQDRPGIATLSANGALQPQNLELSAFYLNTPESIAPSFTPLSGDRLLVFGRTPLRPSGLPGFTYQRLNADGSVDTNFQTEKSVAIFQQALVQPDGKILLSRTGPDSFNFTNFSARAIVRGDLLTRLNPNGSPDETFKLGVNLKKLVKRNPQGKILTVPEGDDRALAVQTNGRILFKYFDGNDYVLVRLKKNGTLDTSFAKGRAPANNIRRGVDFPQFGSGFPKKGDDVAPHPGINQALILEDGDIILAGDFTSYNGVAAGGLIRLNADGTVDDTFQAGSGATGLLPDPLQFQIVSIDDVQLAPQGKLLIAGTFTAFNGQPAPGLARLQANGSFDASFVAPVELSNRVGIYALYRSNLEPLPDGRFLLTGNYRSAGSTAVETPTIFRLQP